MDTLNNAGWWRKEGTKIFEEFNSWLGGVDIISRTTVRDHIKKAKYKTLLDVACAACIDYKGYEKEGYSFKKYTGFDATEEFLDRAPDGVDKVVGIIEDMPFKAKSYDVVVARAILEHLDYYEKAVDELIRVAKKEVVIVFYKKPGKKDFIVPFKEGMWDNIYDKKKFVKYLKSNKRVASIKWVEVSDPVQCDTICYVKVK